MKDKLSKSTTILCLTLLGICILGYFLIQLVLALPNLNIVKEDVKEEIKEEEIISYANYDWSKLTGDTIKQYEDDNYTSMFGIDVAAHQETINWQKVKDAGVQFVYIRLGYRGAIEGKLNIDEKFEYNYINAKNVGLKVGVYWYSQPVSELEAIAEADFVLNVLNGREIDLPIAYDFEETEFADEYSRMHGMSKNNCTAMALAFCNEMQNNGYKTILYTNAYWADNNYDWSILNDYGVWYAQYDIEYPEFDRPLVMWQYSDSGKIDGIKKDCDLNIMFIKKNGQF